MLSVYSDLKEKYDCESDIVCLLGNISVNRSFNNFIVDEVYEVKILIPLCSDDLPSVWDIGNHVDSSYEHRYNDGRLCLDTDAVIALYFHKGNSLLQWMKDIVEPYYFSYRYYKEFGEFPFGERSHNLDGIIEAYKDMFHERDIVRTLKLLEAISQRKYRGHLPCPCGSEIITRKCHGQYILPFVNDSNLNRIVQYDYSAMMEVLRRNDKQRNYKRTPK